MTANGLVGHVTANGLLIVVHCIHLFQEEERHLVVVNVSPIEFGHILIVPPPEKCLPQVHTVWECVGMYMYLRLYVHTYVYVCVHVYMCVSVRACTLYCVQVLTEESVAVSIAMVAHSAWLKVSISFHLTPVPSSSPIVLYSVSCLQGLVCGCQQPTGLCQCQSPPLACTVPGTGDHDTEPGQAIASHVLHTICILIL